MSASKAEADAFATLAQLQASLDRANDDRERVSILQNLVVQNEICERLRAGLAPYHGHDLNELFFPHSQDPFQRYRTLAFQEAERDPQDINVLVSQTAAMFCARDPRDAIERNLSAIRPHTGKHMWGGVTFDPEVYRRCAAMSDKDILAGLPPLQVQAFAPAGSQPILFLSCDYNYFGAFGLPLLRSLQAQGGGQHVHLHVMDCVPEKVARLAGICQSLTGIAFGLSIEATGATGTPEARLYYHAVRFIRFYQLLKHYQRPFWLMDVDALFNRPPSEIFNRFSNVDVALRIRPGRLEPWNQFSACMVGAQVTTASLSYLHMIAAFIAANHMNKTLRWGVDQFAMYGGYDYLARNGRAPTLDFLDEIALDFAYRDEGVLWCSGGTDKFDEARRVPGAPVTAAELTRAKYIALFDKYRGAVS